MLRGNDSKMADSSVNIVCMKWGTRYPSHYVNVLHNAIGRNLSRPFRFLCITDDPSDLLPEVEHCPIPDNPGVVGPDWPNVFVKLVITRDGFAGLSGPTLFLDLDLLILGPIDCFFDYHPGEYCIIHNWIERRKQLFRARPDIGNSSIFRFEAGGSQHIYDTFIEEIGLVTDRSIYPTEQAFLTYAMKHKRYWPEAWVKSFKRHCRRTFPLNLLLPPKQPPADTRFLVFHGFPDPHTAIEGHPGKRIHHRVLPTRWIADRWKL